MRPPITLNHIPIQRPRPCPPFRRAHDNHRPPGLDQGFPAPRRFLNLANLAQAPLHRDGHVVVDGDVALGVRVVRAVLDDPDLVAVAGEKASELEVVH